MILENEETTALKERILGLEALRDEAEFSLLQNYKKQFFSLISPNKLHDKVSILGGLQYAFIGGVVIDEIGDIKMVLYKCKKDGSMTTKRHARKFDIEDVIFKHRVTYS